MLPTVFTNNQTNGFFPTLFNDFFNDNWLVPETKSSTPAINVTEDEKTYHVEVAAPGMTKEDFKLSLNQDELLITMEHKNETEDKDDSRHFLRREFSYSSFSQRFALPDNVEQTGISASMQDGVLHISLPKKAAEEKKNEPNYIEIQ